MSNIVILNQVMGTKYMHDEYLTKLKNTLDNLDDGTIVDLRFCKFQKACAILIRQYYNRLVFRDTENPYMDKILVHNNSTSLYAESNSSLRFDSLPFRFTNGITELIDFKNNISKDIIYRIPHSDYNNNNLNTFATYLAVFIILTEPSVRINIKANVVKVFEIIRDGWRSSYSTGKDAYHLLTKTKDMVTIHRLTEKDITDESRNPDGYVVTENEVGKFYIKGHGFFAEDIIVSSFNTIPAEIGSIEIDDENVEYGDILKDVASILVSEIEKEEEKKKPKKTKSILDVLEVKEGK